MVLEFCPSGSLDTLLQSQVPLNDEQKVKLSLGIARGMLHLHLNNIIHRDLAARNILLSKDGQPKISVSVKSVKVSSVLTFTGLWHVTCCVN
jgi:serine/threonine protein kinase